MRYHWLALAGILLGGTAGFAQQQPQRPVAPPATTLDPARNPIDNLLVRWEEKMKSIESLQAECTRTTIDKVFGGNDVFVGQAKYMKPNLAILDLKHKTQVGRFEKYICTGTFLYEYHLQSKEIRAHKLPPPKPGQVGDDSALTFLFGMKADQAKDRYDLKFVKEDQWYLYVEILPRRDQDKHDFIKARLVLNKDSYLPRQLWFNEPNSNEITWDIPQINPRANLDRKEFETPTPPPTWKLVPAPTRNDLPPRVALPQKP